MDAGSFEISSSKNTLENYAHLILGKNRYVTD